MDSSGKIKVGSHKRCSYGLCKSDARTKEYYQKCNFYFISFPKPCLLLRQNKIPAPQIKYHVKSCEQCKKSARWVRLCGRTDSKFNSIYKVNKNSYICSLHFVGDSGPSEQYPEPIPYVSSNITKIKKLQKGRKSLQEKYNNTLNTNEPDSPKNEEKEKYVPKTEMINYDEMITIDENNIKTEVMEENDKQVFPLASKINSNLENFEIHSENLFLKCEPLEENITRDVGCQTRETFFNCRNEKSRKEESKITAIQSFEKSLSEDKEKCLFYTSLEFSQVKTLLSFLTPKCNDLITWNYDNKSVSFPKCSNSQKFTSIQELIVTLVYLRRALPFRDLSYRFDVSNNLMKNIIITWIKFMYIELSEQLKSGMFVSRSVSDKIPALFKEFKNLRVVVTCAEFYSRSLPLRSIENEDHTYSRKDTSMISKALIGCTPTGRISFVTPVYDGTTSNRKIFIESNLSEFIKPDDLVLIDKEVVIKDLIINQRAKCHIPQFLEGNRVLQSDNDLRTKLINQQKDVINKIISQLKQFHILREELSHEMSKFASEILFICVCIKNLNFKWAEKL